MHQLNRSLSFSHALTHSLPSSCCCPWPWGGRGKRNETPKWNPKAAFGSVLLEIVRDGLRTERVSGSAPTPPPQGSADLQKEKKIPKNRRKPCWSAITKLICAELRSDPGLQQGDWAAASWKMCSPQVCWGNERNLCFGAASNLNPGIVLCIQPTHSETFAPPCGASGTRWIPARNLLPPWTTSFSGANLCKTSKGAFYQKLFTHSAFARSTCRIRLGGVLYSHSFKKINLLLTYCLPE